MRFHAGKKHYMVKAAANSSTALMMAMEVHSGSIDYKDWKDMQDLVEIINVASKKLIRRCEDIVLERNKEGGYV